MSVEIVWIPALFTFIAGIVIGWRSRRQAPCNRHCIYCQPTE